MTKSPLKDVSNKMMDGQLGGKRTNILELQEVDAVEEDEIEASRRKNIKM